MTRQTVLICNELGLHLRAAARIVGSTSRFPCQVWLSANDVTVDGKSLLGITSLMASQGTAVTVSAEGLKEEQAVQETCRLIESGFAPSTAS